MDDIFKAYDVRGKVGSQLNPISVENIGRVYADWLPTDGPVAIGYDMRPDSEKLANALITGIVATGRDVINIGQVTSDMTYFAVGKYQLAGAAMVTASHNPGSDNGIKLYRDQVIAVGLDSGLDQIRDKVIANDIPPDSTSLGKVTNKDITEDWLSHVMSFVPKSMTLKPFRIAVDAGNGMAGKIFPEFEPYVPFEITEMYFKLDGTFPNHEANPQKPENMADLVSQVTKDKLDFGIAFDGDGDRAGFVDDKGRVVSGSDLISIVAKEYLQKYPGAEIVHEVRTSHATQELIREWGGKPYRTKAGRVSIGTVMRKRNAPFGGETTGHLFFKENYFADSGLIGAIMVIVSLQSSGKTLSQLVDEYHRYPAITEQNFQVKDKNTVLQLLEDEFQDYEQDTLDGLTVYTKNGWFNIRPSNTEPLIRLNAEAKSKERLDALVAKVTALIKQAT